MSKVQNKLRLFNVVTRTQKVFFFSKLTKRNTILSDGGDRSPAVQLHVKHGVRYDIHLSATYDFLRFDPDT